MKKLFTSIYFIAVLAIGSQAQNVTVAGSGGAANGSYVTLKDAFDALNLVTTQAGNNITVGITGNTTEAASAVLNQPSVSSWTSLSISPSGGAARTISGAITGVLIDLNGADNVTINGLNTGGNSLTISNTATAASNAIRLIGDASNNIIQNCTLQGSASTASNGVIFFSTGTTTGNDGNNINNCNITAAGTNLPVNGVFSQGTSAAIDNSGNTLNANNISDFFNADLLTTGINIGTGNSTWTITNNKLFQTAARTYTTANIHNGINVGSGDGNIISGNTIGYAASNATGVYTMSGTIATRFIAINLAVGTTTATSVQGNTITAISLATSSGAATTNGILCGINITAGSANMGNVTPNIIGASSGTGALVAIPTTTQGSIVGINSSSTGTILIQNNIIGSFSSSGTTAAIAGGVFGINVSGATTSMTITGNTIGNATANNMMAGTLGLTTGSSIASGINASTTPVALSVTNNTIQNFSSYGTGGGYVKGFNGSTTVSTTAAYDVSNNIITNLTTYGSLIGYTSGASSAVGIQFSGGLNGTCSQNTISNISNLNAAATTNTVVSGITLASGLNNSAFRNKIWGLSNAGTGVTATGPPVVAGIIIRSGTTVANVYNNMISIGNGQTTNTCFIGIMLNHGSTPDPLDNIYFNTVVISGTSAGGALISSCLNRGDLTATARNQVVDIRNNLFINTRTGGTGNHYAISNNPNSTSGATGWAANASNYNVLNAAAATIGYWTTPQTFAGWQTASASDANSISGPAVNLVNIPAGDLHIVFPPSSVIEAAGILIPAVTDDFDGQLRSSFSPTDIGADAGNFVAAGLNMGAEALVTPAVSANGCYTSAETVTIRIRNSDINPINFVTNPVTITTNVTGAVTQTLTAVVNTGSLGAGLSLDVPMSTTLNMGPTGVYTFNAFTTVGGDTNPGNDAMSPVILTKGVLAAGTASANPTQYCIVGGAPTLSTTGATGYGGLQWQQSTTPVVGFTNIPGATTSPYTVGSPITQTMYYRLQANCNGNTVTSNEVTVTLNNPQITGTTPGASCGPGPVTVTLGATGTGATFSWYDVPTGGVPVGTGSSFTTPPISVNTTYYVSTGSGGGITNVGLPAQLAGTSGAGTTNFGLVFDALVPFTLNSVVVYPVAAAANTAGTVTIDVVSSTGAVLNTATVAVVGNPTASATAQTVTLNFNIAAGTNLKLRPGSRSAGITGLLFEPSATAPPGGNYGYPFTIPGVVSILHSTLTAPPANTPRLDLYYYFYNWEVATGCESARTAVLATVTTPPAASISYPGSPYCTTGGTANVTQTGTTGGTYSSTAGLTINPTTGNVTLGTSTPGTYTVTYTIAAGGGCPLYTTTANITINNCGGTTSNLAITKTDGVTTYTPGGSTTYTIVASNAGPDAVTGATVTDNFPAFITSVAWTAVYAGGATGPANGAGNINATVNIPVGGTATFTAVCNISGAASGNLVNTATVTVPAGVTDPNPANNSATDTDTQVSADLAITKTDGVTNYTPGGTTTYTIVASNAGPQAVTGATVTDNFPAFITSVAWTAVYAGGATGPANGAGNINATVNIPVGGSATFTAVCNISGAASGNLVNTATVTVPAAVADPNPANNSATDTDTQVVGCGWTAATVVPVPILDAPVVTIGTNLYSFGGVSNSAVIATSYRFDGTAWTTNAPVPAGLEFPSAVTDGTNAYILGGALIGTGVPQTTLYRYNVGSNTYTTLAPCTVGTWNHGSAYINGKIYKFGGTNAAAVPSNVMEIYDVATNTWSLGAVYPAPTSFISTFVFCNKIYAAGGINTGTVPTVKTYVYDPATNTWDDAAFADLPATRWGSAGAFYNNSGILAGGYVGGAVTANISNTVITWNFSTNTWTTGTNMLGERSRITGDVLSGSFHVIGGRSQASAAFVGTNDNQKLTCGAVTFNADLSITKTDGVGTYAPGGSTTYTIVASNAGPTVANGAVVTDNFPAFITSVAWTAVYAGGAAGPAAGAGNINAIINLPVGGTATFTAVCNISGAASGNLVNTATIAASCSVTDPNPANNSATDTDTESAPSCTATISYPGSPYCSNAGTANVTRTGAAGGTYSSTAGLTINAATGAVTLGTSTPGTYTVTYTIAASGGCPSGFSTTTTITITALPVATIAYAGSPYCQNAGTATVTRTGTAGGTYSSTAGLTINATTGDVTLGTSTAGTYTVTYTIAASGGCPAVIATASITITAMPAATIAYTGSPYCSNAGTATVTRTGTAGGTYSSTAGLTINAATGDVTLGTSTPGTYTVTYTIAAAGGCPVVTATASITITALPAATITYTGSPYCSNAGTATVTRTGTAGGAYSSTAGLSINAATGTVTLGTSTAGTYTVTYTIAAGAGCQVVTATTSITVTALPAATIVYAGSPYCSNAGTVTVTRTGTAGGTYSSTAGLTINAATGDVTLGTSTAGTYTVTYTITAAGGCPVVTATASITINSLSVAATAANSSILVNCGPTTVTLSITGGSLGTGGSWKWYSGTCGGTVVGTGATLTNIPVNSTTTFYVRAEGTCNNTACASVTVTINTQPTISISASPYTSLLPGMLTTLTASVAPPDPTNTMVWYRNGTIVPGANSLTLVVGVDGLGLYTARTTTTSGCTVLSNAVNIKDSVSNRLFITPNPNNGQFKVRYYTGYTAFGFQRHLIMYNNKGQRVYDKLFPVTAPYSSMDVNARHLAKGLYVVMVTDYYGEVLATGKVIIQ